MSQHLDTYMTASSGYSIANLPEREQQNLKNQPAQADEWCGNYLITKSTFFQKRHAKKFYFEHTLQNPKIYT